MTDTTDDTTHPEETTGTFVVTHADEDSAILRDVDSGQVHTLSSNPGVEEAQVVEATIAPEPPMEVTWTAVAVEATRTVDLTHTDLSVTGRSLDEAPDSVGEVARYDRAGEGEIHVITVPEGDAESAATDVLADDGTLDRAARLGVVRVEVRTASADGYDVVSVRYLPD